jgi:hypothetical protein
MSTDTDTIRSAAADAVLAPLDLLLLDAAFCALRRVNPGGFGLRRRLPPSPGSPTVGDGKPLGKLGRITVGNAQVQPSRPAKRSQG